MSTTDKKQRIALVEKLKEKGISPAERSNSSDYKEVIKNVLEHMNNVGGYSSDQVREDIEAIIDLKSANDSFYEVNRFHGNNRQVVLVPILFSILLAIFGLVLWNNSDNEFTYGLGFLTFLIGGLGIAVVFTLYLTPVLYLALARFTKPRADESAKLEKEMEEANAQHS